MGRGGWHGKRMEREGRGRPWGAEARQGASRSKVRPGEVCRAQDRHAGEGKTQEGRAPGGRAPPGDFESRVTEKQCGKCVSVAVLCFGSALRLPLRVLLSPQSSLFLSAKGDSSGRSSSRTVSPGSVHAVSVDPARLSVPGACFHICSLQAFSAGTRCRFAMQSSPSIMLRWLLSADCGVPLRPLA